jgi:hypothetical protein
MADCFNTHQDVVEWFVTVWLEQIRPKLKVLCRGLLMGVSLALTVH